MVTDFQVREARIFPVIIAVLSGGALGWVLVSGEWPRILLFAGPLFVLTVWSIWRAVAPRVVLEVRAGYIVFFASQSKSRLCISLTEVEDIWLASDIVPDNEGWGARNRIVFKLRDQAPYIDVPLLEISPVVAVQSMLKLVEAAKAPKREGGC